MAVDAILRRCSVEKLSRLFDIPPFASGDEFLYQVAVKRNKMSKGGVPDRKLAARLVLLEWNSGKIPFFTLPPTVLPPPPGVVGAAEIVSDWGKVRTPL